MTPQQTVRFWAKVRRGPGCWLWQGALSSHGYGAFRAGRSLRRAHRVAWELANGPIPGGQVVLHACDTPACVNPKHLSIGTQAQNLADMWAKGRAAGPLAERAKQTHCKRGHEFTTENTYVDPRGRRTCRTCRRAFRSSRKASK